MLVPILILIVFVSGCTNNKSQNNLTFNNIKDLIFAPPLGEMQNGELVNKNIIINKETKETELLILDNDLALMDIVPPQQAYNLAASYYKDKVIYGGLNAGGKSVIFELDTEGRIISKVVNFNLIYYDEDKDVYVRQSLPEEEQGVYYLDKNLEQFDFVPLPDNINMESPFKLDILSLEKVVFFGKNIDANYQLLVYDFYQHTWKSLNLPLPMTSSMNVYADFLYSESLPDYIHLYISDIVNIPDNKSVDVNKLYSLNLNTSEKYEKELKLTKKTKKIVQMQNMSNIFLAYDKDGIDIYDYSLEKVELKKSIYAEDIALVGDHHHINGILQYNERDFIVETPYGVFKFNFDTNEAETIYDNVS